MRTMIFISVILSLINCSRYSEKSLVLHTAHRVLDTLHAEKQAVKYELDLEHRHLYWLNKLGEIYRIQADGTQVELINKGFGTALGITYIADFSLDVKNNRIYFTDLFDLQSGYSAIKQSDLQGRNIQTVATFEQEAPLQLATTPGTQSIYYITKKKQQASLVYQLGVIRQGTQEKKVLYTTSERKNLPQLSDLSLGNEHEFLTHHGIARH